MGATPKSAPESPEGPQGTKIKAKPAKEKHETAHVRDAVAFKPAAERSESAYQALAHAARDGIVMIDAGSRMLAVNPAVERIFGYSESELLGKELTLLMPEYLRHVHKASLQRYLETGKRHVHWEGVELPGLHKDGHEIPLEISFGEAIYEKGERVFAGVVRDISARKRFEEALRESEERYRTLCENSRDGIYSTSVDGHFLSLNQSALDLLGYSREELFDLRAPDVYVDPGERTRFQKIMEETGSVRDHEIRLRRKDGQEIDGLVTSTVVKDGNGKVTGYQGILRDVTDRKRAEQTLRQSEEKFRILAETAASAIYVQDASRFLYVNPASEAISGYTRGELLGMPPYQLAHPSVREEVRQRALGRLRGESHPSHVEFPIVTKSGETRWLDFRVSVIPYDGSPAILATAFDVTERRRAERELAQREGLLRAIFETEPECVNTLSRDGNLVQMNRAGLAMIEADSLEQVRGQCIYSLVMPEYRARFQELTEKVFRGESGTLTFQAVGLKGTPRWLETRAVPLRDETGVVTMLMGITRDVTERKRAEEAARESEERFRLVSLATNDAVWNWDLREDRKQWSGGIRTSFGYPHSNEATPQRWWEERLHQEDRERVLADLYNRLDRGEQFWSAEYRFRKEDGAYADVFDRGYVIRDAGGKPIRAVGAMSDISDRKRAERLQSALYRIGEEARSAADMPKLYASIHAILGELMYARNCYIALYDAATDVVSFPYFLDEREPVPPARKFGRGLTEYVLRTGRPLLAVPEMLEELVRKGEVQRIGAPSLDWMGVPLKEGERTFGALVLQTYEATPLYGEKEKGILTFVSQQIATAIEQKRRDQALRESENKFRAVSETTSGGIFIRQGSRFLYVNSAAQQLTGYSREELLAMDHTQIVHPDFRGLLQERSEARLRGEDVPSRYEAKLLGKDGQERWAELTASVIEFGGEPAMLTTTFDITDRKRAEKELAESEAKFRAVAETAAAAIYIHDGTKFLFANRTAEVISGYTREELLAKQPFDLVHPEHRQLTQQRAEARQRGEAVPTRYDFKILTKGGETRWLDFSASVVQFEGRSAVLSMAFDITERKRAEALQGALYRIAEKARSAEALPQLYASIHAILGELMYAKNCYIALYDPATDMVSFPYFVDEKDPPFPPHKFRRGLTEYVLRTGEALLALPEKLDELTRCGELERAGAPSLDWMGVPLKKGGQTFGALVLQSYQPSNQYGEKEKEILTFVSQQIAAAIEGKRNEEAIRESESKFRAVAETAPTLIFIFDGERFYYVNPAAEAVSGYHREELLDMDPWTMVRPDHRAMMQERSRARLLGKSAASRYEFPIVTKSGEERWLDFSTGVIEFGGKMAVLGTAVDVTERKRAEQLQSALYRISEQATAAEDLPQLFASLHAIVGELMYARNFYIALYDAAAGILSFPYFVDEEDVAPAPKKLGKGLTEYVLRAGESLLASPEVFDDLVRRGEVESVGAPSVDWLGVPLKSGSAAFGVLVVQSYTENVRFNEKQKEILTFVSRHVATAIERKRSQAAGRESETKFRTVAETAQAGIYMYDQSGFLYVNPSAERIFGYAREELLAMKDPWTTLLQPEYRELGRQRTQARLRGEAVPSRAEFGSITKQGEERWLDFSVGVADFQGRPVNLATVVDITERKIAERLQAALYRLADAAGSAGDLADFYQIVHGIVSELMDARNFYVALHDPVTSLISFPYVRDESGSIPSSRKLKRGMTEYVLRTQRPVLADRSEIERLHRAGEVQQSGAPCESWLGVPLKKEDNTFGVLVVQSYSPNVRYGEREKDILSFVSQHVAAAIERKRSAEALRLSEARYRQQVQGAVYGIYRSTVDDHFLEVNPALVSMLGYDSAQELLALRLSRDVYADAEERSRLIRNYRHSQRVENVETRWKKKDGTPIEVRLSGRAVLDEEGEAVGFEMIAEDITERRSLEQQLRQSQKMEAVGRLAGGVAHDFNNLLTVIKGYSELMLEQTAAGGPLRAEAEEINKAAARAAGLTRQLLAFSRQQVLAPKILDLNAAVGNMEEMLRRLLGEDIELSTVLGPKLGQVKADPGQVEQVIMNLAVNSRDAMSRGGKLTIETANVALDENYLREHGGVKPGSYVMLAVSDNGAGMDEETRSRIFEPFFTTKEMGKGTGLGLSTVYGIVKQSEGYIWVYSEAGHGTTFKVYLPRVDESAEESQKMAALGTGDRGTETILLVEDEDGVRALVKQVLSRQGYTVIETRHGREALKECERHTGPIPLLLTDVVLPQMSGRELAERLKTLRPDIKVLYMSGYTDDAILRHGVIDQETAFLQKPFTTTVLTRKVREVLDQPA
jgi:PAS domain S-box-containing protein